MDIVGLVAAAVALSAAVATWWQATIAKRQTELQEEIRRDSARPYVWADYRLDPVSNWMIELVVRNEGPTVAENVRVTFDPPIARTREMGDFKDLDSLPAFRNGISSMPPGREMRWTLGTHVEVYEQGALARHKVRIEFDGPFGPEKPLEYVLDYADSDALAIRDGGNLKRLTEELKKTNKALTKIAQTS